MLKAQTQRTYTDPVSNCPPCSPAYRKPQAVSIMHCKEYLQDDGMPSQCVLQLANDILLVCIIPFSVWSILAHSRGPKSQPSKLRITGFLAGCACIFSQNPLQMIAFLLCLVDEWLQLFRSSVAGGQQLIFYASQTFLALLGYNKGQWRIYADFLYFVAFFGEFMGSNNRPLGYPHATIFSRIGNSYLSHMLSVARTSQLTREDFAECPVELNTGRAHADFAQHLVASRFRCLVALLRYNKWRLLLTTFLDVVSTVLAYIRPLALGTFLTSLKAYRSGEQQAFPSVYLAILIGVLQLSTPAFGTLMQNINSVISGTSGAALTEAVYRKTAKLSNESRQVYDSSKIMNLLNVDVSIIQDAYSLFPTLIEAPVGLVVCTWQLYHFIGKASFAAIPVYGIFIPYTSWHVKKIYAFFPQLMKAKDARTKSLWGIFRNIKSLKLYAWEEPYEDQVSTERSAELKIRQKYWRLSSVYRCITIMMDDFVASAIFISYLYYSGHALTPEIVFPTLSLLAFLSDPFTSFPSALSGIGRALTSQERLTEFLTQKEHESTNYTSNRNKSPGVEIEDASISWNETIATPVIKNLSLSLGSGDLCCIVGRVGTGKTALLRAICDQMYISSGRISVAGTTAYCPQEPWLQFKTVRENILFGLEFNEDFYQQTIKACELEPDIRSLPKGDLTQVGEKGICLSGGQKARVALARAVYSRADVYVLDDVLSAVDEHVSRNLVASLFSPNSILANKTIVLATNSTNVLRHASVVVSLVSGGNYSISGANDGVMPTPCASAASTPQKMEETETSSLSAKPSKQGICLKLNKYTRELLPESDRFKTLCPPEAVAEPVLVMGVDFTAIEEQLSEEQKDQKANVVKVFFRYLKSAGWPILALAGFFFIASVVFPNLILIWLTVWSDKRLSGIDEARFYVAVYLSLSAFTGLSVFLCIYYFYGHVANDASATLHAKMVQTVLESPMTFFDTTPMGAIMNRFTGDVSTLDGNVPTTLLNFCRTAFSAVCSFLITLVGAPFLIVAVVPLMLLYNNFRKSYIPCSRQVQRISSASRGPILSHIEESVKGIGTVKAFARWPHFIESYQARSDYWMQSQFLRAALSRWLGWRVRLITVTMIWCAALSMVFLAKYSQLFTIGLAGIVMHTTQRTGVYLARIIRTAAGMEVSAVAAERIFEFCDLETEASRQTSKDPKGAWPSSGEVDFRDFSTRYRPDLPIVLKNISMKVKPQEKIGVVGRTGAAKSTLCLSIFRILEAAGGEIDIGNTRISELGLKTLRRNLSIIPQDAQIFSGTLRQNLTPLSEFNDEQLRHVLRLCHLEHHFFEDLGTGLESELLEGGENLSRGQAQLICLGRALLHDSPVLVLDEATASVDTETDAIVQQTIRKEFKHKTIITIAHRLNTIMDCDRVLVLDHGQVKEFDTPENLLAQKGEFYALAQTPEDLA